MPTNKFNSHLFHQKVWVRIPATTSGKSVLPIGTIVNPFDEINENQIYLWMCKEVIILWISWNSHQASTFGKPYSTRKFFNYQFPN